jgi:hypothetical protein
MRTVAITEVDVARNRKFESISLQRRVGCKPASAHWARVLDAAIVRLRSTAVLQEIAACRAVGLSR